MNGNGLMPSYGYDGGISGPIKVFYLLVFLFFMVFLFSSSSLANVDLTNSSTTAASTSSATASTQGEQVIAVQDNSGTAANASVPVTGGCSDPYTIQDGDTLSQIATRCNITLAEIRQLNPGISNANLIYAGQQIRISNGSSTTTTLPQPNVAPVTGGSSGVQNQSQVVITSPATLAPDMLRTGTPLQVRAVYFPPNTPVTIAIGPKVMGYNVVAAGMTDSTGTVVSNITVPAAPDATTPYVVVVITSGQPVVQAMSKPFYIVPAQ